MKSKIKVLIICLVLSSANYFAQFTKLFDFDGSITGSAINGSFVTDGTYFYGMTASGGTNNKGTIFRIMPDGSNYLKLFDFDGINGAYPKGSLISDGTFLYGITSQGGTGTACSSLGCGVIFKIKLDGTSFTKLLDFNGTNGNYPYASLISDGTYLYGTTEGGGANLKGTIFKIKPDGTSYMNIFDFNGTNGKYPRSSFYTDGVFLYGMTDAGGVGSCTYGCGVIFKIKTDGSGFLKLFDFSGANGSSPYCTFISDGTFLYGMTYSGGTNNKGTIFKIMPDGSGFSTLLNFDGINGDTPWGSLVSDGTYLYGMTNSSGSTNQGLLFKIKLDGTGYNKVIDFTGTLTGSYPQGTLFLNGPFIYGGTTSGGVNDFGTIFKLGILTSIDEKNVLKQAISIFPNPTNATLSINSSLDYSSVKIVNSIGRTTLFQENKQEVISISDLSNGIYFIQLLDKKGNILKTEKFIKE